jgi:hypothetical protein
MQTLQLTQKPLIFYKAVIDHKTYATQEELCLPTQHGKWQGPPCFGMLAHIPTHASHQRNEICVTTARQLQSSWPLSSTSTFSCSLHSLAIATRPRAEFASAKSSRREQLFLLTSYTSA